MHDASRGLLELAPAFPWKVRGRRDLAHQASPLGHRPLQVAGTNEVRHEAKALRRVAVHFAHEVTRAVAIVGRHAVLEIARMFRSLVRPPSKPTESATGNILAVGRKSVPRAEVGNIVNQIVDRIGFVLERGRDR